MVELRNKENELVITVKSDEPDGVDRAAEGNRRASVDHNNNHADPDLRVLQALSFVDETDSTMFKAAITNEVGSLLTFFSFRLQVTL